MKNHLQEILTSLVDAGVKFVVGGGVAAVLQGVERVTMDLDLAVAMDRNNLETFISAMKRLGLKPRAPVPPEYLLNPANIKLMIEEKHAVVFTFIDLNDPMRTVDLFLLPELSYHELRRDADEVRIAGDSILITSKEKLIELKRNVNPIRSKDILDIEELTKLTPKNNDS